nr:hypothetical protein [Tanacetum cinerariifolium]
KMVESDTPKKKKLQEQIDVHVAREMEEQLAREDQRRDEQIARDAEIARIHAEEELQMLIDGLDRNNETIAKCLQECEQFAEDLSIREKIDMINELVKYQDHYVKKSEHNVDFHQIVDFVEASHIRSNLKLNDEAGISSLPDAELFENLALMGYNILPNQKFTFQKAATIPTSTPTEIPTLRQYSRRARIAQSSALPTAADEPASPSKDVSQGEAFPTMATKFAAQELEIATLKVRIKLLEAKDGGGVEPSGEDATIKGRSLETGEEAGVERSTERGSNDIEELQMLIDGLDRNNETIAKYLPEYEQFAADLSIREKIDMINELVKYQDQYAKVLKYQSQQSKPFSKKQQREFYMAVLKIHSGWKTKRFKGMTLEEIREKFIRVWKQIEDFVPMASKEEGERVKRKGLRLEQKSAKKMKTSEEVSEEDLKEMMQLVPVEETLVKETLSIRQDTSDKEKELWVELKRLFKPDVKDQLWTHTQALMHDLLEWRLYDSCGVHHVLTRDQEIFMLVEKDYPLRKGLAIVMISNKL